MMHEAMTSPIARMQEASTNSLVKKRSVVINGHKTSISLEPQFWDRLVQIAKHRKRTIGWVVEMIKDTREHTNLSSAIRLYILERSPLRLEEEGPNHG
jgi:predicted DNA-binding ribbon-helix-helix protein